MQKSKDRRIPVVVCFKKDYKIKKSVHFPFIQTALATSAIETSGVNIKNLEEQISLDFVRHVTEEDNTFSTDIFADDIKNLSDLPFIEKIEPVFLVQKTLNDLPTIIEHPRISNDSSYTGKNVTVAVIDSGIDDSHPDLRIKREKNNSIPDLRKKVVKHLDITGEGEMDADGHGTHVAGIIAGNGEASQGKYTGVAPDADLINIKVLDQNGNGRSDDIQYGISEAIKAKADVINMSLGITPDDDPPWVWPQGYYRFESKAVEAVNSGILVCVAAGNDGRFGRGTIGSPARVREVLTVGSVTKEKSISSFSSRGPVTLENLQTIQKPDLVAPGGDIDRDALVDKTCYYKGGIVSLLSSSAKSLRWYYWTYNDPCRVENFYRKLSGTSQASPVVGGIGAILIQAIKEKGISVSGSLGTFVKEKIMNSCVDLGLDSLEQGKGLVSVKQALESLEN